MTRLDPRDLILAIDTATTRAVVALGTRDGNLVAADAWQVGHRHAEELLGRVDGLLEAQGLARADASYFAAVAVGTGPGAFTGLRVGLATAKALARGLGVPLVGVPSGVALLAAFGDEGASLLLPAGPSDAYVVSADGSAAFVPGGGPVSAADGGSAAAPAGFVAIDLAGRADAGALERGDRARAGFPAALVRLAAGRLAAGEIDDPALLVPEYVALPRGMRADAAGGSADAARTSMEVTWSPARP